MNIFNLNLPNVNRSSEIYKLLDEVKNDFKNCSQRLEFFEPFIFQGSQTDFLVVLFPINNNEWSEFAFDMCHKLSKKKDVNVTHDSKLLAEAYKIWAEKSSINIFIPALFYM